MLKNVLMVGLGGFAGSIARYLITLASMSLPWGNIPAGTFICNAAGSLLIGVFMASVPQGGWHLLAVTGFCGGFTTFSTFSAESLSLFRSGNTTLALLYITASAAVCILFVSAGMVAARHFIR